MEEYIITDHRRQNWITAIVALSVFIFSIDYSMVNISLPSIAGYFKVNLATVAILPMAYLLIVTSTILGFGKLGDIKGHKIIFISGLSIFTIGTILCGISPNIKALIGFRAFQSVGEACMSPVGIAMITYFLPDNIKGRSLGFAALAQGLGIAIGSAAGGYINSAFTWRAIFFIDVPLLLITILLAVKFLPSKQAKTAGSGFDYLGASLIFAALAGLIYGMNSITRRDWSPVLVAIAFSVSLIAFILFIVQEKRSRHPLLDLGFFRNPNFAFANLAAFSTVFILIGFGFLAPFYFEMVRKVTISQAGLLLVIPSVMMMALAPIAGKLSDSMGSNRLCSIGTAALILSFVIFLILPRDSAMLFVMLALFLLGLGAGFFITPNNKLVMAHAPLDKQGSASGVYKIFMNIGSVFGISVFPVITTNIAFLAARRTGIDIADIKYHPDILQAGFRASFIFAIILCVAALVFSILAKDKKKEQRAA